MKHPLSHIRMFGADQHGTVLIFFAVILLILLPLIGGGLDVSRAVYTKARLISALESAGLAASIRAYSVPPEQSDEERKRAMKEEVDVFFKANFPASHLQAELDPLRIGLYSGEVHVSTCVQIKTYLLRFINMHALEVCHGPAYMGLQADELL